MTTFLGEIRHDVQVMIQAWFRKLIRNKLHEPGVKAERRRFQLALSYSFPRGLVAVVLDQFPVLVQRSQITITCTNQMTPYIIRHFSDYFLSDFSEITAIIATSRELLF